MKQYSKEETWKIYETLPPELQEAVFSGENAEHIFNICERNNVDEVSHVAYHAGLVLLGLVLPNQFQDALQKEVKLPEKQAEAVAQEVNRLVFFPVRRYIQELHETPQQSTQKQERAPLKPVGAKKEKASQLEQGENKPIAKENPDLSEEKSVEQASSDPYREPIE